MKDGEEGTGEKNRENQTQADFWKKQQVKEASSSISPSTAGVPTEGTQKSQGRGDRDLKKWC